MTRQRIILDCDPGRDDALAIAMALASPDELDVLGVTTVAGNVPLDLTQRNARLICELCGHPEVKVFAGAESPLKLAGVTAEHVHGGSGLEGMEVRQPAMPLQDRNAIDFIVETLETSADDEITLVATGPLTNLALAFAGRPEILPKIRRIVLMGGACREGGNVTPSAEFNIHVDPDAAHAVFACRRPLVVINIDVTNRVLATPAHADRLLNAGARPARELSRLLKPAGGARVEEFGPSGVALHDPCTIAWLLKPGLFETKLVNVSIETKGDLTLGATVVDFRGITGRQPNALWACEAASAEIIELLIDRIARL